MKIILSNCRSMLGIICAVIALCSGWLCPATSFSQLESPPDRPLIVGVIITPPLFMKAADGKWEGFCVELWNAVAQGIEVPYEFREFDTMEHLLDALEKREIDVIPSLAVRDQLESTMDFSQSYLKSGLSIAVPAESDEYRWIRVFEGIFSEHTLKAIASLFLLSLAAGVIVWLFERHKNSEMFGHGMVEGISHGVWWAMVTMTTVGYGDKAPKTTGGRAVALVWMIFSIIFIASFTANITSSLTIRDLRGKVRDIKDLYEAKVGSIPQSEGFDFLTKQGIAVIPFESIQEGMEAVAAKRIDAFVSNEQILRYQVKKKFPGRVQVLPGVYGEYFVSIAVKQNSPLRKQINKRLLKFMKTQNWTEMLNRYMQ